jgi:hypothetical protein
MICLQNNEYINIASSMSSLSNQYPVALIR